MKTQTDSLSHSARVFYDYCLRQKTFNSSVIVQATEDAQALEFLLECFAAIACKKSEKYCASCESCHKILTNQCQDILNIYPEQDRKAVNVEQVRQVRESAFIYPGELDFKVFIIHDCDFMLAPAQNALLKILEEPPKSCGFVLVCSNLSTLLPTIRSRCRIVKFSEAKSDLYQNKYYKSGIGILDALVGRNSVEYSKLCASIGEDRENYRLFLKTFVYILRNIVSVKNTSDIGEDSSQLYDISKRITSKKLINIYNASLETLVQNEANVNIAISQNNLFNKLWLEINP